MLSSSVRIEGAVKREMETVITRKGQITIPAPIRRALDLHEGDRVAMVIDGEEIRLRRRASVVERTAGVFRHAGDPPTAEELRRVAECTLAEDRYRATDEGASWPGQGPGE